MLYVYLRFIPIRKYKDNIRTLSEKITFIKPDLEIDRKASISALLCEMSIKSRNKRRSNRFYGVL
jgi:hypothetical protein